KNTLTISLNNKRSDSFLDVGKYASLFAIGCFIENVKIAAEHLGLNFKLDLFPYVHPRDTIAAFTFTGQVNRQKENLFAYIPKRVTNRQLYNGEILSIKEIATLENALTQTYNDILLSTVTTYEE